MTWKRAPGHGRGLVFGTPGMDAGRGVKVSCGRSSNQLLAEGKDNCGSMSERGEEAGEQTPDLTETAQKSISSSADAWRVALVSALVSAVVSALVRGIGYNGASDVMAVPNRGGAHRVPNVTRMPRQRMMEQQAKILIVDSDPEMSAILALALSYSEQGYELHSALGASEALPQLGIVLPDLLILEVTMPNGEGWDALRRIRELSTVPVIALVDRDDPEVFVRSLDSGADCCLVKPVSLLELSARVRVLLRRQHKLQPSIWHAQRLAA